MADRRTLSLIGFVYGVFTAAVVLVAALVVSGHVRGQLHLASAGMPAATASVHIR